MIGLEMVGTSNIKWIPVLAALLAAFSCVKEEAPNMPSGMSEERFSQYDPVVRFGLETYMGGSAPETKTTYAGDDKTILYKGVRYERINWNAKADATHIQDIVQIKSQTDFTPSGSKKTANYKVVAVKGRTNPTDNSREDVADTEPITSGEEFYWSASDDKHYFYAVYPTSDVSVRATTKITSFDIDESAGTDPATHVARVSASINKKDPTSAATIEESRRQRYLTLVATPGGTGTAYEYMPDMTNAFMYAAAAMPGADAGYSRVPLRFKPLYSAVKLIITGGDDGARKYRLKRVDLRTDLHNNGALPYRSDLNPVDKGTPLGGAFSTSFKVGADGQTGTFEDIEVTDVTDTLKRLFIEIPDYERVVLGTDTVKVTFLLTPVKHKYFTVDYTFEYLKGSELDPSDPKYLDPSDPSNWTNPANIEVEHRYLNLQQAGSKGVDMFDEAGWYELLAANKLYVRSSVPRIQYYFNVEAQSFFPRTYNLADRTPVPGGSGHYQAPDFYSVVSYRDSAGIYQPLKWKVIGYSETGYNGPFSTTRPSCLALRGDDGTWDPAHADNKTDPYNPTSGVNSSGDPWSEPWGYGTHMEGENGGPGQVIKNGNLVGYTSFKTRGPDQGNSFVFYNAGSQENNAAKWIWSLPASFTYRDQDGNYYYPKYNEDGTLHPHSEEAYAYDLSSHDIYGNLTVAKNGDLGTTANCYVVTATGWYRIPTVYGNAIRNGSDNPGAYTGKASASPETLLGQFLDHANSAITQPWINKAYAVSKGTAGAELVWEDATDLLGANVFASSVDRKRGDQQKPFFWEDPKTGNGYVYFYVNQLASANAVLKVKSGSTTLWSWHIWCVPDVVDADSGMLATVAIEPTLFNYYEQSGGAKEFPFQSVHADKKFFKKMDLGLSFKEDEASARRAYVRFAQYWKGEIIDTVVVCFAQSGVKDAAGMDQTPVFQWGRKDPLVKNYMSTADATVASHNLGKAIQNPNTFYYGNNKVAYHGRGSSPGPWNSTPRPTRYDNLWNSNVDYNPETFNYFHQISFKYSVSWYEELGATTPREGYFSNDYRFEKDPTQLKGRRDTPVRKTVYDPCPPGFVVPNLFAFTAFNNRGVLEFKADARKVASNWNWTTGLDAREDASFTQYYDFYVGYDKNAGAVTYTQDVLNNLAEGTLLNSYQARTYGGKTVRPNFVMKLGGQNGHYRRDPGGETVRLYAFGRINGNNTNAEHYQTTGYYWLAEPATAQDINLASDPNGDNNGDWAFGSTVYLQKANVTTGLAVIYPVAGGWYSPWLQTPGISGKPTYAYNSRTFWARNKFQRTHGEHIRPMEDPNL